MSREKEAMIDALDGELVRVLLVNGEALEGDIVGKLWVENHDADLDLELDDGSVVVVKAQDWCKLEKRELSPELLRKIALANSLNGKAVVVESEGDAFVAEIVATGLAGSISVRTAENHNARWIPVAKWTDLKERELSPELQRKIALASSMLGETVVVESEGDEFVAQILSRDLLGSIELMTDDDPNPRWIPETKWKSLRDA